MPFGIGIGASVSMKSHRPWAAAGIGLNYVSCSPFRVPVARLAAAQAAVQEAGWRPMPAAPRDEFRPKRASAAGTGTQQAAAAPQDMVS